MITEGIFFCSEILEKLIKPLRIKILLLPLYCKTKPHTTMIDIIELVRIARAINTGQIPRLGDVAAVISPKGANATSAVIEAFRNRYRNSRMSVQEVVRLSNWAGLPVATFTAADIDVNLKVELTNHHNDENQDTSRGSVG